MRLLIEHGADTQITDCDGHAPLNLKLSTLYWDVGDRGFWWAVNWLKDEDFECIFAPIQLLIDKIAKSDDKSDEYLSEIKTAITDKKLAYDEPNNETALGAGFDWDKLYDRQVQLFQLFDFS